MDNDVTGTNYNWLNIFHLSLFLFDHSPDALSGSLIHQLLSPLPSLLFMTYLKVWLYTLNSNQFCLSPGVSILITLFKGAALYCSSSIACNTKSAFLLLLWMPSQATVELCASYRVCLGQGGPRDPLSAVLVSLELPPSGGWQCGARCYYIVP